jgi:signal transduction histidine kinase
MSLSILTAQVRFETDLVQARQRTRQIAQLLGLTTIDETRLATAVSEIARNSFAYAGGCRVEFLVDESTKPQLMLVRIGDSGPGITNLDTILEGRYTSKTGLGLGITGARRLVDHFEIQSEAGQGTTVTLGKKLPLDARTFDRAESARVAGELAKRGPLTPVEEVQQQNRELLAALDELNRKQQELTRLNSELEQVNASLDDKAHRLEESERMLRARNEELKAFAYTVSHDLKAPLRGIAGYAQELDRRHREGLSERALFCLKQILTATRNLDNLIEDLLHYSRLDSETPSLTDVDVRQLIESILADRKPVLLERGVEVEVSVSLPRVRAWERGLRQVLTNLIDNAIKYTRDASPARISIAGFEVDSGFRIEVKDNGIGFDMKYHDRIFGLFNRLVRAEEFDGTGAGLAIVKKVLEKQGGRVWAESEPGNGATFFVEFATES